MAVYVVGDIHGCFDEWMELKNKIEKQDESAKFILLGDIVDRGHKQKEMLDWALEHITLNGKYQMIMGNHEEMKLELKWIVEESKEEYGDILDNYGWLLYLSDKNVSPERVIEYIEWMEKLPLYKDITVNGRRFIIVHGGVSNSSIEDNKIKEDISRNIRRDLIWNRDCDNNSGLKDTTIVHGHTPTLLREAFKTEDSYKFQELMGKIYSTNNKYNLDCGLVFKHSKSNLAALKLDTLEEIYLYEV